MRMLWQRIRPSEEQQTFSTSSNRAALSATTHAVWPYCLQAALKLCFVYIVHMHTYTQGNMLKQLQRRAKIMCAHTHRDKCKHSPTHWSPTVERLYQHLVTSGRDAASCRRDLLSPLRFHFVHGCSCVCLWAFFRWLSGWVNAGLFFANIWSLDYVTLT